MRANNCIQILKFSFPNKRLASLYGFLLLVNGSAFLSAEMPKVHESGLTLTLFAEDPDIVTPIGMVVGDDDKIYVIESHTHNRPTNYKGPSGDVIKVFVDGDKNGVADSNFVFAEGFKAAMNLAFSKDGTLYVLCAWSLYALPDRDGDGVCDGPELILNLETKAGNPHGCWLGITFDAENHLFISRGNVSGEHYRIQGKDGSVVEGYGDGGNVIRANPDGTDVQEWATGFWNSMDLKFDHRGNLLLVDNDPDARGPNRLLRVVRGGDYGHIHMFGGGGRHPFQGWDGSFPGHLPFLSGTGEAPSGILDVSGDGEYSVLVSVWNENTIERHTFLEDGTVEKSIFMSGGKDFRPVALDQDSDGNLIITDWMLVDYPNHGKGRIWRVSKLPIAVPVEPIQEAIPRKGTLSEVSGFLQSKDPFVRHAAEMWMVDRNKDALAKELANNVDARVRVGAYLTLRRMKVPDKKTHILAALKDADIEVRRFALFWAAEQRDLSLRSALDSVLTAGPVTPLLFNTYLAAMEMVNPGFISAFDPTSGISSKKLPRQLDPGLLIQLAGNKNLPAEVRAQAIHRLEPEQSVTFLSSDEDPVLLAAIGAVSSQPSNKIHDLLLALAMDSKQSDPIRVEAVFALSKQSLSDPTRLLALLNDSDQDLVYEVARTLRYQVGNAQVKEAFEKVHKKSKDRGVKELAEVALYGFSPHKPFGKMRPTTLDDWLARSSNGGEPARGSRVFRSTTVMCTRCHAIDGLGTNLGPDLGGIAQSVSREQIARSILRPSDSFPPQYQAWNIYTTDGNVHSGIQIDHQSNGAMLLYTTENINRRFEADEVKDYEASPYSLMPPGLEHTMTAGEFNDLVAYLSSLE
jgi:putative membrane-bound dehydrogenase-like protein